MWEESYLSRKSESVFSWHVVSEWLSQLILKNEYHKKSAINISKDPGSMQLSFFDYGAFSGIQRIEPEAIKSVFTVSQELIDEVLCIGFNDKNSRLIIACCHERFGSFPFTLSPYPILIPFWSYQTETFSPRKYMPAPFSP